MLTLPSISREYLHVPVTGTSGAMPVQLAFVPDGTEPTEDDWHNATLDDGIARLLIGQGSSVELEEGVYRVWVRVTAHPERPAMESGLLEIT